ncbi:MAG: M15 family metallopeptidase [Rikenellaceae bacterium]
MNLRVIYNVILCRLGLRKILPSDYINSIPIEECDEELCSFDNVKVRYTVFEKLKLVRAKLQKIGYDIELTYGYRSLSLQRELFEKNGGNKSKTADPNNGGGGHQTGGAVDLRLTKDGNHIDMGGDFDEFNNKTATFSPHISNEQRAARKILYDAMTIEGFENYPNEWWHYCYGDRMWAAYSAKRKAIYGSIEKQYIGSN